jgi:uncharacterized protein YraI
MQAHVNLITVVALVLSTSVGLAQQGTPGPTVSIGARAPGDANAVAFPYVAEITGTDVNIRSGPGTNYYRCGMLDKNGKVRVVSTQSGWSRIVPPAGSFSWISRRYISPDPANPTTAVVTRDAVAVYAGSDYVEPMHSTSLQLKLDRGDRVRLLGEEKDDYYKIVPPDGAYLWISSEFTKVIGPVGPPRISPVPPLVRPIIRAAPADINTVVPMTLPTEAQKLQLYYDLKKQVEAETARPLNEQDFASIKEALEKLVADKEAGRAARYAHYALEQVKRCELARQAAEAVRTQETELQQAKQQIVKTRTTKLGEVEDLGQFAVIGILKSSTIYAEKAGPTYYRIVDQAGSNICYAQPVDVVAEALDLKSLIGKKVGLVGMIVPHPQTAGALVRFTHVVDLTAGVPAPEIEPLIQPESPSSSPPESTATAPPVSASPLESE